MKIFKKALLLFAVILLFPLIAACGGGEKLADAEAWSKAFTDTNAELRKADLNLTLKVDAGTKMKSGGNSISLSSKVRIVFADEKVKQGNIYYAYNYPDGTQPGGWYEYAKNKDGKYEKVRTNLSDVPSVSDSDASSVMSFFNYSTSSNNFDMFDYKSGNYILNLDKYLAENKTVSDNFVARKDKLAVEISFKNGLINRMSLHRYSSDTGIEIKVDVVYNFGGASVRLPTTVN